MKRAQMLYKLADLLLALMLLAAGGWCSGCGGIANGC